MEWKYKNTFKGNYIVIANNNISISDYRLNMLIKNSISNFMDILVSCVDGIVELSYDISSKQSIRVTFENTKMEYEDIVMLLKNVTGAVKISEKYLLKPDDIILTTDLIFMDCNKDNMWFCYYPNSGNNFREELRELIQEIMLVTKHSDKQAVELIYGVYNIVNSYEYTLEELEEYVDERNIKEEYEKCNIYEEISVGNYVSESNSVYDYSEKKNLVKEPDEAKENRGMLYSKINSRFNNGILRKISELFTRVNNNEIGVSDETMCLSDIDIINITKRTLLSRCEKNDIEINEYPCVIGKMESKADCVISDKLVSRVHVRILYEDNSFFIEDLNSMNGTYVNGNRLRPYEKEKIEIGDIIRIAVYEYIFK